LQLTHAILDKPVVARQTCTMPSALKKTRRYTPGEEIANSLTHGIGAGLSVAALVILVTYSAMAGDAWRVVSFAIYGTCLTMLYLASTLYHAVSSPSLKQTFRTLDHAAIFLLISGSYTPITLVCMGGGWGWTLFGLNWGFALVGICVELFYKNRPWWLTVAIYVGMGWLVVIAAKPLGEALEWDALFWIFLGGFFYTGGIVFYVWKKLPYNHAIWHLFVLGGSISHFLCFILYVV
jgi:hemolysin III